MFFRMFFGLPGAAAVTALLFLAMGLMVRQEAPPVVPVEFPDFSITAEIPDSKPQPDRIIRPPTNIVKPPPTEITFPPVTGPGPIEIAPPTLPPDGRGPIAFPTIMRPTVKFPPAYPEACASKGAEGVVIVEFDVTAEGNVVNPRIVSSADSCFGRAVLRTIVNWKYSPQTDGDGRPVMRRGVREFINFKLES